MIECYGTEGFKDTSPYHISSNVKSNIGTKTLVSRVPWSLSIQSLNFLIRPPKIWDANTTFLNEKSHCKHFNEYLFDDFMNRLNFIYLSQYLYIFLTLRIHLFFNVHNALVVWRDMKEKDRIDFGGWLSLYSVSCNQGRNCWSMRSGSSICFILSTWTKSRFQQCWRVQNGVRNGWEDKDRHQTFQYRGSANASGANAGVAVD